MSSVSGKRDANANYVPVYNYVGITTTSTTVVKTGAGFLHAVTINKPVATGTVKISDALSNTTPVIGTITTPANPQPVTLIFDVEFSTGLTIEAGVQAQDITISYI